MMGGCSVVRGSAVLLFLVSFVLLAEVALVFAVDEERRNVTDSFADIIDRALQKEFPESEQNGGWESSAFRSVVL